MEKESISWRRLQDAIDKRDSVPQWALGQSGPIVTMRDVVAEGLRISEELAHKECDLSCLYREFCEALNLTDEEITDELMADGRQYADQTLKWQVLMGVAKARSEAHKQFCVAVSG